MNWLNGKMNNSRLIGEYNALPTSEYLGREEGNHYKPFHAEDEVISDDDEVPGNHNQTQLYKKKMKEQDKNLGILEKSLEKIGHLSKNISIELKQQNKMLDELEVAADNASIEVESITKKTEKLLESAGDSCVYGITVTLTLILILLILLVIYF